MNLELNLRSPKVEKLQDDRLRITRIYDIANNYIPKQPLQMDDIVWLPWGTADSDYTDCRLTHQNVTGQAGSFRKPVEEPPQLVRVYEEIPANDRVIVGEPSVNFDQFGRRTVVFEYVQFSAGTSIYSTVVGTTAAPAPFTDCILQHFESDNDGTLITSKYTFIDAGILSDTEELKFGGKLKLRTIKGLNEIPATPDGYTLVTEGTDFVEGLPVYIRGFAAGGGGGGTGTGGEISREVRYGQSIDEGTIGTTVYTIKYLSDLTVDANPITPPVGTVLIDEGYSDEAGFRVWTAIYATGEGLVVDDVDIQNDGKLYLYSRVALGAAPSAPSATIGGTVTLVSTSVRNADGYQIYSYKWAEGVGEISRAIQYQQSENQGTLGVTLTTIEYLVAPGATVQPTSLSGSVEIGRTFQDREGVRIWSTRWAKGTGLVSEMIHARQDGLREVTDISLGSRVAPSGDVIRDDYRLDEGFTVYTVTAIQAADGTSPTGSGSTVEFQRYVPFLYPGRAKAYNITASNGWDAYDVFRSPPVKADVKATITVSYQTGNTLGTISDYWNPSEWAVIQAEWIGLNNIPGFAVVALPGYRSVDDTPLVFVGTSPWTPDVAGTMLGNIVFAGTTAQVTVSGGPEDPGGNTYTLDATIEPAYTKTDGTKVYRKTLVSAAIPAQAALPV